MKKLLLFVFLLFIVICASCVWQSYYEDNVLVGTQTTGLSISEYGNITVRLFGNILWSYCPHNQACFYL